MGPRGTTTLAVWLAFATAACATLVAPDVDDEPTIDAEWALAQATLARDWGHPDAYDVWPSMFSWHKHPGPLTCGDIDEANGCFAPRGRRIDWNVQTPTVIRHEAGHAILWKLGDERWHCYEHTSNCREGG